MQLLALTQLGILLAGVAAIAVMLHAVERTSGRVVSHHFGWNGVLVTGWLGVPLHELAHLVTAKLFGHRIVGVAFFDPDPATGTLGYVRHAYSKRTAWQLVGNFVIGIAPLIFGALALAALCAWMIGPQSFVKVLRVQSRTLHDFADLRLVARDAVGITVTVVKLIWRSRTWWLPLQLYLCICVASHCAPSGADLAEAWQGGLVLVVALVLATLGASAMHVRVAAPAVLLVLMTAAALLSSLFQLAWAGIARASDAFK